jgi:glycosyltransferase involved in cell wall biosynthesis
LRAALARRVLPGVELLGRVSESELAKLYARCRALVYPQEEDFGIAALEAQASGRPVIAFGRGGAVETVLPLTGPPDTACRATGVFFETQSRGAVVDAVQRFEDAEPFFDAKLIRSHAERFSATRFRDEFMHEVRATLGDSVLDAGAGAR